MTYVISNPCGNFEKVRKMLQEIRFCDRDTLFVIGNLVDYGSEPMELISDLSVRPNVYPIAGDRDYLAAQMLSDFEQMNAGKDIGANFMSDMAEWIQNGGLSTMEGYRSLDKDGKEGALDYLSEMVLYEEIEVKGKKYVFLFAGVADYESGSSLDDYLPDDFFSAPLTKEKKLFDDAIAVIGGVPTESGKIEYGNDSIFLDCDVKNGGKLACLCLDTSEEFYI